MQIYSKSNILARSFVIDLIMHTKHKNRYLKKQYFTISYRDFWSQWDFILVHCPTTIFAYLSTSFVPIWRRKREFNRFKVEFVLTNFKLLKSNSCIACWERSGARVSCERVQMRLKVSRIIFFRPGCVNLLMQIYSKSNIFAFFEAPEPDMKYYNKYKH